MEQKRLFSPIEIHGLVLKNRVVMPAIHHLYTPEGYATERFNQYYWKRAEGGAGLIIVGGCRFDDYGTSTQMMSLQHDKFIPGWENFVKGMHQRGAKVAVQLYHAGRYAKQKNLPPGAKAKAPSPVYSRYSRETPEAITKQEISQTIQHWADAAKRAKTVGFDAVELLASAGYLLGQFLSPLTNLRQDEYGGSWENRCRFANQLVATVRQAVGPAYPLFMRISGSDFMEGGNTSHEAVAFACAMEKAGINMLDVTGGWHESKIPQITGDLPRGTFAYLSQAVKQAVSIPVMACNRLNDPLLAEQILALEQSDLIGMGRPLIADPQWVNKAERGRLDEIRYCVACNQGCLANTFFGKPVECLVNREAGREYQTKADKPPCPKNILVVGAGLAGCEFALEASKKGHTVTMWEQSNTIAPVLDLVAASPGKSEFKRLQTYYRVMMEKANIRLALNKPASPKAVQEAGFDTVVLATGSLQKELPLPDCSISWVYANDIISQSHIPGKNVVIIGGGSVGCETAQYLARKGSITPEQLHFLMINKAEPPEKIEQMLFSTNYTISIVEVEKSIGKGFAPGTAWPTLMDLKRYGVAQYTSSQVSDFTKGNVIIQQVADDNEVVRYEIPCDTLVVSIGARSNRLLYESLQDSMKNLHVIGDASQVGQILEAIRQGGELAEEI